MGGTDISSFLIAGFAVVDDHLQNHIAIPNNHVDIDIDIDVDIDIDIDIDVVCC